MTKRFWFCGAMTLLSAAVSAYFSIAGLLAASSDTFARYAASRSVALLIVVVFSVLYRRKGAVITLAWVMTLVQLMDGWIGLLAGNPFEAYGPFAFAVVNAVLAAWLCRERV